MTASDPEVPGAAGHEDAPPISSAVSAPAPRPLSWTNTAMSFSAVPAASGVDGGPDNFAPLRIGYRTVTHERTLTLEARATRISVAPSRVEALVNDVHQLTLHEVGLRFNTDVHKGLDPNSVPGRIKKYGPNALSPPPSQWLQKLIGYLFGGFAGLLWVAAIITFISWQPLGGPNPPPSNLALGICLLVVIALQAGFTAFQDFQSSRIMASINSMLPQSAMVTRGGTLSEAPVADLVPGDLVAIKYGQKVPADMRLVQVAGVKLDNSILTGESVPINGTVDATDDNVFQSHNMALMGTFVTEGEAMGIVVATGDSTMMGRVAKLASQTRLPQTLLQKEIQRFVYWIAALAITTAVGCLLWYLFFLKARFPTFLDLPSFLSTDMGVLVAYVPEGLPIAVTVVLTIVARRMFQNNVLVKNLSVVETLGCCSVICSDKTGTLTTNQMVVNSVMLGDAAAEPAGKGEAIRVGAEVDERLATVAAAVHLCNGAAFDEEDMCKPIADRRVRGDATDTAMLRFGHRMTDAQAQSKLVERAVHVPFNSKTKRMVTVLQVFGRRDGSGATEAPAFFKALAGAVDTQPLDQILLVKGAPDYLLPHCGSYASQTSGTDAPLDDATRRNIEAAQERMSGSGQRVLLVVRKLLRASAGAANVVPEMGDDDAQVDLLIRGSSSDLTVLGLVGIVDPPRPETKGVVETMRGAGVRVYMVTGDFPLTAAAIGREVGIFTRKVTHTVDDLRRQVEANPDPRPPLPASATDGEIDARTIKNAALLLSGGDLRTMADAHWHLACDYLEVVFARTTPEQKLQIVHAMQDRNHIVGVTGDGVNDAPALKNAHLGIAMGSGSDVAMAAGAMVLLDSNFASVVEALRQGRVVFENLKKVCVYLLPAGSFAELMPVCLNLFLGLPLPLSGFLMIVICMMTDLAPSMSLMYEGAEENLLARPPRRPGRDNMVNGPLFMHAYLFIGLYETIVAHGMYFAYMYREWGFTFTDLVLAFDSFSPARFPRYTAADLANAVGGAQCVYFVTLVILQFGNLLATRTRRASIVHSNPVARNPLLFAAMCVSLAIAALVVYLPAAQFAFGTFGIPAMYWFIPLPFAAVLLALDELRKLRVRTAPDSALARLAW